MNRTLSVTPNEWVIMELLWENPRTLMELVNALAQQMDWSKSTVTTMVRRMLEKGLIDFQTDGRTKIFHPAVSRSDVAARETHSLLSRAYHGSIGLMVSAMAQRNDLTTEDIAQLYAILQEAEAKQK